MITEKTVELNLTAELLNWFFSITQTVHFAMGPTLRDEARLGFDAAMMPASGGGGILVQYKRAYVQGSVFTWHLNRTVARDQHARLLLLEQVGIPVFYALPLFYTPTDLASYRRRLLLRTAWPPPSAIPVPNGGVGHHDVRYAPQTGQWWLSSEDEITMDKPPDLDFVTQKMEGAYGENNLLRLCESFFPKYMHREMDKGIDKRKVGQIFRKTVRGLDLVVRPRP